MKLRIFAAGALICAAHLAEADSPTSTPIFRHTFNSLSDESGAYAGQACNGAFLEKVGNEGIVNLGDNDGYFDFGTELGQLISSLSGDFSISVNLCIPTSTTLGQNGNFIFNFSQSSSTGYLFFGANQSRYSITETNWTGEQTVSADIQFPKGEWTNLIVVQKGSVASIYFNGELKKSATVSLLPSAIGNTQQNWLGRSPYTGDVMLKGAMYSDFRIYNSALSSSDIATLGADPSLKPLNDAIAREEIEKALASLSFDFSDVRNNLVLPTDFGNGITAVWESDNHSLISPSGVVTRPEEGKADGHLTLKVTVSLGDVSITHDYPATVAARLSDSESVEFDLSRLSLRGNLSDLRSDLLLPSSTTEGSSILWKSSDTNFLSNTGKLMNLAAKGSGTKEVTLTATAFKHESSATRDFTINIAEDEGYDSYLFVYFPSNEDENLYYALSTDGFNYTPLNNGNKIMASDTVAIKKGIRDPHILRGVDGKTFYMVATDMRCAEGWDSNRGIVLYKSSDLVNWTHSTVNFPDRFPEWKNVTHVWAPEAIWDPDYSNSDGTKGRYMVYFSLLTTDGKCPYDKIYYSYANDDFTDLLTDPVFLYDRGSATIDGDIVFDQRDNLYHMVYKNEGSGGICQVTASRLTASPGELPGSQWGNPSGTLQQTDVAVEGAGLFRMINSDTWILMYDCYGSGYYQFCSSDDLENFTLVAQTTTSGAFTPRHGTVIQLTPEETSRLLAEYPIATQSPVIKGARNINVRSDRFKLVGQTIQLAVRPNTDLSNFDPDLYSSLGATITPTGAQDFSNGPISYTVSNGTTSKTYDVSVTIEANPVLPGFKADPEIMFSHKTGRFYIYPTSDGYSGWSGYSFNAYSSTDLVNWQLENCILDLSTSDVTWATGNAWAPSIEEKFEDGAYRYYFYFSGHNPEYDRKTLGCAISDSPTGPFHDLGHPLIHTNITDGQLIDSDVFTDPADKKTYFYWGNGSLVASRLDPNMTTISDPQVITPAGGTLSTYAFREGIYVFKRNGIYYFLWSVDDTGASNYHVAYGTSTSPMGPISVAENPVILSQDRSAGIYGTGHNSIIQIPGRDEWYIVYHRINRNYLSNDPGCHREVCIDRLEFNADGSIKPVTPTHRGIDPVDISDYIRDLSGTERVTISPDDIQPARITSTLYYDTAGRLVGSSKPATAGIYIRLDRLENGGSKTSKVIIRPNN